MRLPLIAAFSLLATAASAQLPAFSLLAQDPDIHAQITAQATQGAPWVADLLANGGTDAPMAWVIVDGQRYAYAETCDPTDCDARALAMLVAQDGKQAALHAFGTAATADTLPLAHSPAIRAAFHAQTGP